MLKIAIPEEVWSRYLCLIVHPGIKGDRGPSLLDWAIARRETTWGVTILEAAPTFDSGAVLATHEFALDGEARTKSSLYRGSVNEAAVRGVLEAITRFESSEYRGGFWQPETVTPATPGVRGCPRPQMRQADRAIDWTRETMAEIACKIRAGDSAPGVLGTLFGQNYYLYGAQEEAVFKGPPGEILAERDGAICIGTIDGGVWISHLKAKLDSTQPGGSGRGMLDVEQYRTAGIKLPATYALGRLLEGTSEDAWRIDAPDDHSTYREIRYTEHNAVGYLAFDFYNGAVSTDQCHRLRAAFLYALAADARNRALGGRRSSRRPVSRSRSSRNVLVTRRSRSPWTAISSSIASETRPPRPRSRRWSARSVRRMLDEAR